MFYISHMPMQTYNKKKKGGEQNKSGNSHICWDNRGQLVNGFFFLIFILGLSLLSPKP